MNSTSTELFVCFRVLSSSSASAYLLAAIRARAFESGSSSTGAAGSASFVPPAAWPTYELTSAIVRSTSACPPGFAIRGGSFSLGTALFSSPWISVPFPSSWARRWRLSILKCLT